VVFIAGLSSKYFKMIEKRFPIVFCLLLFLLFACIVFVVFQSQTISVLNEKNMELNSEISKNKSVFEKRIAELQESILEKENKISELNSKISLLEKSFSTIKENYRELKEDFNELSIEKTDLEGRYSDVSQEYSELKKAVDETIQEINEFEEKINESIQWFKNNSKLGNSQSETTVKAGLNARCITANEQSCYAKSGCFYLINLMEPYGNLEYLSDENDKLLSIRDFLANGGGDCEDFALFYKAEINHFLEKCREAGSKEIEFESYELVYNSKLKYWLDNINNWYIEGATKVDLKEGYVYPNVVCGNILDLQTGEIGGHCVIALTKNQIKSTMGIYKELNGAPLIEPQDGSFMGYINSDSLIFINENGDNTFGESQIYWVITDDDYYSFDLNEYKWTSYHYYLEKIQKQKEKLTSLK